MPVLEDPEGNETRTLHELLELEGQRVLEIGCGTGRLTWRYADKAAYVIGIDPIAEDIATAKENRPGRLRDRVEFLEATIEDYELPPGAPKFDVAIFAWSL